MNTKKRLKALERRVDRLALLALRQANTATVTSPARIPTAGCAWEHEGGER